jgi:hypothetical protein
MEHKTNILFRFIVSIWVLFAHIGVFAAPVIGSILPNFGPTAGGTNITINGTGFSSVGEVWGKQTTGLQDNIAYANTTDNSGNVFMAGSFEDTITFDGIVSLNSSGGTDCWLAKYTSAGVFLWAEQGGGPGDDVCRGVEADSLGNVYITGSFSNTATFGALSVASSGNTDAFVAKYNSAGVEQWLRKGGSNNADLSLSIAIDASNNVIIAGSFRNTATFGALSVASSGNTDAFVAKYNSSGTELWLKKGGSNNVDSANGVSVDSLSNVYITGNFRNTITFGSFSESAAGSDDVFVVKYNSAGVEQWTYNPNGSGADFGYDVDVDTTGNVLVTGFYTNTIVVGSTTLPNSGGTDIFLFKLNTSGAPQWAKAGIGGGADIGYAVITDTLNNVYISGSYSGGVAFGSLSLTSSGSTDVFIAGYNSSGSEIWVKSGVGSAADVGNGLTVDSSQNLYVTGQYLSTSLNFGPVNLTNGVANNPFLIKYSLTPSVTIDGNSCINVVYISATQLTCTTPPGTSGAKNVIVTNPDGSADTSIGGFTYGGQISFSIRNVTDTANFNSCDLGDVDPSILSSCAYRLKINTDSSSGYVVYIQSSGGLTNGSYTLNNAAVGTGGAGGSNISGSTLGIENYGILINQGSITGSGAIARTTLFNAGATNSVNANYASATPILQSTGANNPAATDTTNTALVTHNLNVALDSVAGSYDQTIIYTVAASF